MDLIQLSMITVHQLGAKINIGSIYSYCSPSYTIEKEDFSEMFGAIGGRWLIGGDYHTKNPTCGSKILSPRWRERTKTTENTECYVIPQFTRRKKAPTYSPHICEYEGEQRAIRHRWQHTRMASDKTEFKSISKKVRMAIKEYKNELLQGYLDTYNFIASQGEEQTLWKAATRVKCLFIPNCSLLSR